ncbi:MAG: glycosyltransferase family 39 protein [Candidatus Omnitrophota bacterium]
MKISRQTFILFFLFLLNFLFRLSLISKGPFYADCLLLAVQSKSTLETFRVHYLEGTGLPFTTIMGAVFVGFGKWLGMTDIVLAVNFMNVVLSSLCVPVFYLFLHKLFGRQAALVGALVLSFNTIFLGVSTFGNSQVLAALLFLAGLLWMVQYFQTGNRLNLFFSGIIFGLLGAARLQDLVATAPALALLLWTRPGMAERKLPVKDLFVFFLIVLAVSTIFYIPSLVNRKNFVAADFLPHYMMMISQTLGRVDLNTIRIVLKWMFTSVSLLGCLGAVAGFWLLAKRDRPWFVCIMGLVFLPMLVFALFWYSLPRIYLIPAIMLIIPLSYAASLFNNINPKQFKVVMACLIVSLSINGIGIYQTVKFRHDYALLPDFYRWMNLVTEPGATIIERDHSLFIKYYARRIPLGVPVTLFEARPNELLKYKNRIDFLLGNNIPVYITDTGLNGFPDHLKFDEFMHANFEFEHMGDRMIEDWYNDVLVHSVVQNSLYRVRKKKVNIQGSIP